MENNSQVIRSVQRAIDVLQSFSNSKTELTLTEISNEIGLAKSTTSRLIATLEGNHFLEKDVGSGKYRLGRQLYFLGITAGRSIELKEVAKETMIRLRDQLKETINLYVLEGEYRVCIQQFESLQSVKHMIQIGQALPLTVGASGKVLLAYEPKEFIDEIMEKQVMVKSKENLLTELNEITINKYTESIEEREAGTSAAAAPIFNTQRKVIAALSVSGPAHRFNPREIKDLKTTLVDSALEISKNMGFSP
ncbi:IclR family transcriptional regulator [Virgibacillus sp. YIM 98842]|uniref:IclR family transcriptional regulator n=1 Tax=Virgibacillus sp. YIM 98842 TaxID=2663533 RepID=UPI0013DA76B1|nr:IclR family transcriptional regulator [Virgibacillus sp. YIM 98842]